MGRAIPPHGCSRQRRHSARCFAGACLRRRRHRTVPHRAHVLRRRPSAAHARDDPGEQRERTPHGVAQAAAVSAQRFRRHLPRHGRIPGHHPHARSSAARVPAAPRRSDGRDREAGTHQAEVAQAEGTAHAAQSRRAVARSQPHARTCAAAAWASPIPRSPRCRRAPSSRPPSRLRRKA